MARQDSGLHVALLPWLAFGHLTPFLQLAVALAKSGHRISFLSTPRNTLHLLPQVPGRLLPLLTFVDLPLPRVDGLPENAESTAELSLDQSSLLKTAYDLLLTPVKGFLASSSPDWLIHDFASHWAGAAARECGVRSVFLSTFPASSMAFAGPRGTWADYRATPESLTTKPDWIPFPDSKLALRRHEAERFFRTVHRSNASGLSDFDRVTLAAEGCDAIAVKSCHEYEGEYLDLLPDFFGKPVVPVGLLIPPVGSGGERDGWGSIFRWLDGRPRESVVFVSFGSEYKLSRDETRELALGLERAGVPFLWALRRPGWLPDGFAERTKGRGRVEVGWAPQLEILAHPSVGGSLFHCGFGSIVETLRFGHVLVLLPFVFDQGLNARFLVEKGLGIEVERDGDGCFGRDEVAAALRAAMVSDEGEELRRRAREMGAVIGDQLLHEEYVRKFAEHLRDHRGELRP